MTSKSNVLMIFLPLKVSFFKAGCFQDYASTSMLGMLNFHHDIMFFMILIFGFVS
jgi:hypothetical protein